jgi:Pin2-interacting protein X1
MSRRIKISHDPNNLTWAQSAESYGQKLLSSQGWRPGQGLGAHGAKSFNSPAPAIKVAYKDNNLGLGASLKSANPEQNRTGLDAFQGLLGRLNSKDEVQVKQLEQKSEDRKLAMWTQGKWGGVMFVPGGLLVQGDNFRKLDDERDSPQTAAARPVESPDQKAARKVAKALRKAERRERKEAKLKTSAEGNAIYAAVGTETHDPNSTVDNVKNKRSGKNGATAPHMADTDTENAIRTDQKKNRREMSKKQYKGLPTAASCAVEMPEQEEVLVDAVQLPTPPSEGQGTPIIAEAVCSGSRNGRHLLRGRHIQAKRMAFADAKLLDEVW